MGEVIKIEASNGWPRVCVCVCVGGRVHTCHGDRHGDGGCAQVCEDWWECVHLFEVPRGKSAESKAVLWREGRSQGGGGRNPEVSRP